MASDIKIVSIPGYNSELSESLYQLQLEDFLCDVLILGEDGDIKAHSVILSAVSPYFRQCILKSVGEDLKTIYLKGEQIQDLQNLITLIYTGSLSLSKNNVHRVTKLLRSVEMKTTMNYLVDKIFPNDERFTLYLNNNDDFVDNYTDDNDDESDDNLSGGEKDIMFSEDGKNKDCRSSDGTRKSCQNEDAALFQTNQYVNNNETCEGKGDSDIRNSKVSTDLCFTETESKTNQCNNIAAHNSGETNQVSSGTETKNEKEMKNTCTETIEKTLTVDQSVKKAYRKCSLCHKVFRNHSEMMKHRKEEHNNGKSFRKCGLCHKIFKNYSELLKHRKDVHLKGSSLKCTLCNMSFENQWEFQQHQKNHSDGYTGIDKHYCYNNESLEHSKDGFPTLHKPVGMDNTFHFLRKKRHEEVNTTKLKAQSAKSLNSNNKIKDKTSEKRNTRTNVVQNNKERFETVYNPKTNCPIGVKKRRTFVVKKKYCKLCDIKFESHEHYIDHRKDKHSPKQYAKEYQQKRKVHECNYSNCRYSSKNAGFLARHKHLEHGEEMDEEKIKIYRCEFEGCQYFHVHQCKVMKHRIEVHSMGTAMVCQTCGKQCKSLRKLKEHEKSHVPKEEREYNFQCEICEKRFETRNKLNQHHKVVHDETEKHLCHLCPYSNSSNSKRELEIHLFNVHQIPLPDNRKIYRCTQCDYYTVYANVFKSHMDKHSGEKNYACDVCGKTFSSEQNKRQHARRHKLKKVSCPYEGCSYLGLKPGLKEHIRSMHEYKNIKPFACQICEYRCNNQGNLTKHLRGKHRLDVETRNTIWDKIYETGQGYGVIADYNRALAVERIDRQPVGQNKDLRCIPDRSGTLPPIGEIVSMTMYK